MTVVDRGGIPAAPGPGIAILGLGTAGAAMLSAALSHRGVRLVAVGDSRIRDLPLTALPASCRRHATLDAILEDEAVDIVHVATPTPLHLEHVAAILAAGRHVIVEKPMTIDLVAGARLLELARASSQVLIVGHSESFEPYARAVSAVVADGAVGVVSSVIATRYTDWLRRPRLPEELDPSMGGGLVRRQGVHQIDLVRSVLGGGRFAVRAARARRDLGRGTTGSYLAWLENDQGAAAVILHDGTGRLDRLGAPSGMPHAAEDEAPAKRGRSDALLERVLAGTGPRLGAQDRDELVVLGTEGEVVASDGQVRISRASGARALDLGSWSEGRAAVIDEMLATVGGAAARHDAAWALENIRICEEIESAATRAG